jgi:hypothetical protein
MGFLHFHDNFADGLMCFPVYSVYIRLNLQSKVVLSSFLIRHFPRG